MGYIGNEPTTGHFPVDNLTSSGGSTYTLSKAPASAGAIEVSVQGILQPTTAYSVSGTTLTLAGVANNVNIFVRHLGETLTLPTIADGVVTTSKLAVDAVGVAELSATGTASNTTFLRGDNSWTEVDALPTQTSHSGKYLTTNGSAASWGTLDTDANTTTKGIYEHSNVISVDYVIGTNNNALTAGPITINSNISVTVPSGSTWVIA